MVKETKVPDENNIWGECANHYTTDEVCVSLQAHRGVMVSMLASSRVDHGFEPRSGQIKDYKTGICCFSAKHTALRSKTKDWLTRDQNNVSKLGDICIRGLLFQWASTIKIQLSMLVKNKSDLIIISLKTNLFSPWYGWKIAELALNNTHSLTVFQYTCI
jgi:hypothetical protein